MSAAPAECPRAAGPARLLARRLGHGLLLLFGVSLFSFVLLELAPGSFFDEMRLDPRISPETIAAQRARYGVDRPLPERYGRWLTSLASGEMGYSFAYGTPVGPLLHRRALNTVGLAAAATALAWLLAVPLGVWFAARRGSCPDRVGAAATSGLLATPDLLLALALLLAAARTGWLPTGGMVSRDFADLGRLAQVADVAWHAVLPVTALVLGMLPGLVRHVRASMLEALRSPFVRAARAHGIPARRLLFRHALPAAANPLCSLVGLSVASLLSTSMLVEVVMGWPGLGPLLLEAILARDVYLVIGPVMASTLLLLAGNLLGDALLLAFDPRIRREAAA
ncbi:MAG: ABC transporter permease [Vicinamibacteria bacterium]